LEPAALAQLLFFTGILGLGARSLEEGRSFLTGKLGEQVFGPNVTIRDDAANPLAPGLPFDFEGRARRSVALIENGIAVTPVHDTKTAAQAGVESTGHALPPGEAEGPLPLNLVLDPGDQSLDELIAGTPNGLLVTQLHYVNVVDPRRLLLTGMTRNGTFRIKDGVVGEPVKNLRFTQSAVDAFNHVEALGRELSWQRALFGGSFLAPAARIANFNFSSVTDF
ncbi:MAG: metallopeptidase TldD-related protein, partial [Planctomycetota bacterium]